MHSYLKNNAFVAVVNWKDTNLPDSGISFAFCNTFMQLVPFNFSLDGGYISNFIIQLCSIYHVKK